jgi:aryl-alcohol dehydrogenase-like predicted oxidoreductase
MQYRRLGKTELLVSALSFGTWGFANDPESWVGANKEQSTRALLTSFDQGINFIDTARVYGDGLAEEWIGEILQNHPHDVFIASKIPPLNQQWSGMKGVPLDLVFPKNHIISQVNESLRALQTESIDLMYFHVWEDEWAEDWQWQTTIQELTQAGKVRFWGISTNDYQPTNCLKACQTGLISVVMTIFNLFYQQPISMLFPQARELDLGIVARVPLDEGGLTGKFHANTTFPPGDFRQHYFSPSRLMDLESHVQALQPFIRDDIESIVDLALRYILSFPSISSASIGTRSSSHARSNAKIADKPSLSEAVLQELQKHAWNRNYYEDN